MHAHIMFFLLNNSLKKYENKKTTNVTNLKEYFFDLIRLRFSISCSQTNSHRSYSLPFTTISYPIWIVVADTKFPQLVKYIFCPIIITTYLTTRLVIGLVFRSLPSNVALASFTTPSFFIVFNIGKGLVAQRPIMDWITYLVINLAMLVHTKLSCIPLSDILKNLASISFENLGNQFQTSNFFFIFNFYRVIVPYQFIYPKIPKLLVIKFSYLSMKVCFDVFSG